MAKSSTRFLRQRAEYASHIGGDEVVACRAGLWVAGTSLEAAFAAYLVLRSGGTCVSKIYNPFLQVGLEEVAVKTSTHRVLKDGDALTLAAAAAFDAGATEAVQYALAGSVLSWRDTELALAFTDKLKKVERLSITDGVAFLRDFFREMGLVGKSSIVGQRLNADGSARRRNSDLDFLTTGKACGTAIDIEELVQSGAISPRKGKISPAEVATLCRTTTAWKLLYSHITATFKHLGRLHSQETIDYSILCDSGNTGFLLKAFDISLDADFLRRMRRKVKEEGGEELAPKLDLLILNGNLCQFRTILQNLFLAQPQRRKNWRHADSTAHVDDALVASAIAECRQARLSEAPKGQRVSKSQRLV